MVHCEHVYRLKITCMPSSAAYINMLKGAKKAKEEGKDSFEYFVKTASGSEAYKLTSRGVECKENVAGMTLIFMCMALMKLESGAKEKRSDMILVIKSHLSGLMKMRTSTGVPLCIVREEEGIMFAGEGMALRFLNTLIIIESLLIAKLKGDSGYLKDSWGLYSPMDLVVYLELPALLNNVLDEEERMDYATCIESSDVNSRYYKERKMAADLVRATVPSEEESNDMIIHVIAGIVLLTLYTVIIIQVVTR